MRKKPKKFQPVKIIIFIMVLLAIVIGGFYLFKAEVGQAVRMKPTVRGAELALISPPKQALVAVHDTAHSTAVMAAQAAASHIEMVLGKGTADTKLFHEIDPTDLKTWQLIVLVNGKSPSTLATLISVDPNAPTNIITAATAARNAIGVTSVKQVMTHPELTLRTLEEAYP